MPKVRQIKPSDDTIGSRLDWAIDICERAEGAPERYVGSSSLNFVNDMMAKFEEYGAGAYCSQAQMDWLERIETILDDNGL